MIPPEQQIKEAKKQVNLTDYERAYIRSRLFAMMGMYPLPGRVISIFSYRRFWRFTTRYAGAAMALILILSTTVAAAENALPGDKLYPIKTAVNEEVVSLVTVSPKSQAKWEGRRAERRLEEAVKLASDGKLTAEKQATIAAGFKEHTKKMDERVAGLKANEKNVDVIDVTSEFEANLRAREKILTQLSDREPGVTDLTTTVEAKMEAVAEDRKNMETKVAAIDATEIKLVAEDKLKAAMSKVDEVKLVIQKAKGARDGETLAAAQAKLEIAEELVAEGKSKLGSKNFGEAFLILQAASRVSQEGHALIEVQTKLNIEIKFPDQISVATTTGASIPGTEISTTSPTTTDSVVGTSTATTATQTTTNLIKKVLPQ